MPQRALAKAPRNDRLPRTGDVCTLTLVHAAPLPFLGFAARKVFLVVGSLFAIALLAILGVLLASNSILALPVFPVAGYLGAGLAAGVWAGCRSHSQPAARGSQEGLS